MPPKKRDKELESQKTPRTDQIQADHELFLQAFETGISISKLVVHERKNVKESQNSLWISSQINIRKADGEK
ncbi:Protein of unknown function [Cotesia congregata]|uniref:Uncharacterized protein n=1 Tax=Cotesia congregata TaxID=51543 RepID=A0A8J2HLM1_COTCN|nr:Protein of unknown function [Cotesia congregata]